MGNALRATRGIEIRPVATTPESSRQWIAFEIWTRHRIYLLSRELVCVAVLDRQTKIGVPHDAMIGWTLDDRMGPQSQTQPSSRPLPQPGDYAFFKQGHLAKRTSMTSRVVIRIARLTSI